MTAWISNDQLADLVAQVEAALPDMDDKAQQQMGALLEKAFTQHKQSRAFAFFNDNDTLHGSHLYHSRDKYPKHMEFLDSKAAQRLFCAANRVGKTETGAYEVARHATGLYPSWWKGTRYHQQVDIWAAGKTNETTRDIIQQKLFGNVITINGKRAFTGDGAIPGWLIGDITWRQGIQGLADTVKVKHVPSGEWSTIGLKSYEQGRGSFEGTAKHVVWCDEEPPLDVFSECLIRTATVFGIIMVTFTPLEGMSEVVRSFKEAKPSQSRLMVTAGWDDIPHLDEKTKAELLASIPPHELDARTKGIPSLGSGAVYPVSWAEITVDPFKIPDFWPRAYGLDVGFRSTAAVWGAWDRDNDTWYIYREYKQGEQQPASHVKGIQLSGDWIRGAIDPASRGRSQIDGKRLYDEYLLAGLLLVPADNAVEAGIHRCLSGIQTGKIKIFNTLVQLKSEYEGYRRDTSGNGKVVKEHDHLLDAWRYLMMTGPKIAQTKPIKNHLTAQFKPGMNNAGY